MLQRGFSGKFYKKCSKQFALFSSRIKKVRAACSAGRDIDDIAIYLKPDVAKSHNDLRIYTGMLLSIHGMQADVPIEKINANTIVAFGLVGDKEPTMATRLICFRNVDIIISNIKKHVPVAAELTAT